MGKKNRALALENYQKHLMKLKIEQLNIAVKNGDFVEVVT